MKKCFTLFIIVLFPLVQFAQDISRVTSVVDSTHVDNMVLIQTFEINTPLENVWNAYTTKKGWESWAVPVAAIDFRIGGLIQTNYNKEAKIGDEGTIRLHIKNYVPKKMLTLQAELTENFPEFMKEDAQNLYNVIVFEKIEVSKTKVISYGIGYKNTEKYLSLLKFFISGNEKSYLNLISYLETGQPSVKYE